MPLTAIPQYSVISCHGRELTAPSHAREQARKSLFGWGLAEHAEDAALIISELVTNAIRHGAGPVIAGISYGNGHLRIEVHDDGPDRPVRSHATAYDQSWRGLAVIDGLIELYGGTWGVTDDDAGDGKIVYVSICVEGGPPGSPAVDRRSHGFAGARRGRCACCLVTGPGPDPAGGPR